MLNQQLIKDLREFGLTEYEARAYLTLTIHGSLIASQISQYTKIPLSKIYDVMTSLKIKGLAESINVKPKKFRVLEPYIALRKIIEKKQLKTKELMKKSEKIIQKLKPMQNKNNSEIWICKGKKAFLDKAIEMIERCNNIGYAVTENFSRYPPLDAAFIKALKRGVKIKLLGVSMPNEIIKARAQWYSNKGAEIKVIPMKVKSVFGFIDNKEICVRVDNGTESDFIWSNNKPILNIFQSYFEKLWKNAESIQQY
ncbi:MAG: TrmB family transcriptional regulator [Candidatus Aenigmarchaeota archaeon]|nr:TrmB family transcriptional regulator [Candidatus Aenigmarchaeota archaeon]